MQVCVGAQNFRTFAPAVQGRALRPGGRGGPERAGDAGKRARRL